jgi:hypothetical protein
MPGNLLQGRQHVIRRSAEAGAHRDHVCVKRGVIGARIWTMRCVG